MSEPQNNRDLTDYYQLLLERRDSPMNQLFRFMDNQEYQKEWGKRYLEQLNQNKDEK